MISLAISRKRTAFRGYLLAALIAFELLMSFSFLGYIHVQPISVTFAYIPVLLAGCLIGPASSSLVGLVFGLASMWKASAPYVAEGDRIFSPLLSNDAFASFLLSIGARVLFGAVIGLLFLWARKSKHHPVLWISLVALSGRFLHSLIVYTFIELLFPEAGLNIFTAFAVLGAPDNVFSALISTAAVAIAYQFQQTVFFRQLGAQLQNARQISKTQANRILPAATAIAVLILAAASALALYFIQRMQHVLAFSGYDLDEITQYNLLHLQIQFLLGLLSLFFLVSLFLFFVYRYTIYVRYEAKTDALTGILNRNGFFSLCRQTLDEFMFRENSTGYFMVLDIDHFKQINDTFGHPKGDDILSALAQIIKENFDGKAVYGRIGGDEFAILLFTPVALDDLKTILGKFQECVYQIPCDDHRVSCSIGAVPITPPPNINVLYRKADHCLYMAKREGRDQFFICDSSDCSGKEEV